MPEWSIGIKTMIAAVAAIGGVGYWVGKVSTNQKSFKAFMSEVREGLKEVRKDMRDLRKDMQDLRGVVGRAQESLGEVRRDMQDLRALVGRTQEGLEEVRAATRSILGQIPPGFASSASPIQLTDLGKKAAEVLDARAWAAGPAEGLIAKCAGLKEHQIYRLCQEHAADRDAWPENMDECAYEFGADAAALMPVLAIVLRDELLKMLKATGDKVS